MEAIAVAQARARLERSRAAITRLRSTKNASEIQAAWVDFLMAADAVYSKLGAGAKSSPKSRGWFERKMAFRKADELLNYIHQAKNSDFHGLDDGLRPLPPQIKMVDASDAQPHLLTGEKLVNFRAGGSIVARAVVTPPHIMRLCAIINRGVTFAVPKRHLDKQLTSGPISDLADAACDYLSSLVNEAAGLIRQT